MSKIFSRQNWKNVMCMLWIITVVGLLPPCDSLHIHDSVPSKCDKDKLDNAHVCQISKEFNHPSTRCLFTFIVECEGSIYAGPGSLCKFGLSLSSIFECKSGIWTSTGTRDITDHRQRRELVTIVTLSILGGLLVGSTLGSIIGYYVVKSQTIPPSIQNCPKSLNIQADSGKDTASVPWNKPTVEKGIELRLVKGKEPNSIFNEGETGIMYHALDPKTKLTATCVFYVNVTVHYCSPSVTYSEHRKSKCTNERPVQGSSCSFTCDDGYNLNGASLVTCNGPQGTWSSAFPVCTARSCGNPGEVEGGTFFCPGEWLYPKTCFITCKQGYEISGVPAITCKADGVWSSQSSHCRDVESPKFPNGCPFDMELFSGPLKSPVNVTWNTPEVTDNSGLSVNLTSDPSNGSSIDPGIRIIKFTATDVNKNSASCSFKVTIKVRSCPPLSIPNNGRVTCVSGYVEGSVCTVTCSQGYTLEGNASLTCTEREQWSVDMPVCEVIMCPSQPIVNHGVITCGHGRQYSRACTLSCHPGFKAVNPLFIECLINGSWTLPGECIDVEPPTFVNGCPDNLEVSASRLGLNTAAIWSQPIVNDNSGGIINITSSIHNGSVFPPGVTFVTYTAVDGSGNSRSCHFSVTVTTLRCATPDLELPNRTRTLMMYDCPNGYVYGATCSLSCSHGFPLVGVKYIMCEIHQNTAPPSMYWNWTAPSAAKPECRVTNCSTLAPPKNGALSCFLGNFGWDCLMSCNSAWDVPMATDGHFYCTNSNGFWTPSRVPDCIDRVRPTRARLNSDMFYYTGSCNMSIDKLRQNFITRLNNSTWKDACANVPLCTAENVQVTCGPMRRKRSDENSRLRNVRDAVLYVAVKFDIVISYEENGRSSQDVYQEIQSTRDSIFQKLQTEYETGYFDEPGLQTSEFGFGYLTLRADCPPGTAFIEAVDTQTLSCKGCGKGHYLSLKSDVCEVCPVGTYSELENATTCTPCTSGWSTYSSASQSASDCKELCAEGTMSKDGFLPCQVCPLGQYQPAVGSITCHSCAAGTWTLRQGSKGIDQCISVDAHLKNTSLSLIVKESWSELSVGGWILLTDNSSASLTFDFGSDGEVFELDVFSEDIVSSDSSISNTSYTTAVINISSGSWSRLFLTLNSETGNTSVYHNGIPVLSFHQSSFSAMTPGQILISAPSGTVVVSGFHAKDHIVSEEYKNESSQTCIDPSHNILSWTPTPSTLDTPSKCDPVDECLLRPCGDHPCENLLGGFVCHCQDGWTGETCNVSPNTCETNYCHHGSECVATSDSYTCRCKFGYTGTHCDLEVVDGEWSSWSKWSDCTVTCGGGQMERHRLCDDPAPTNGGGYCTGVPTEIVQCNTGVCPVNGEWSSWSPWKQSSNTCGRGMATRTRICNNPAPENGGSMCDGVSEDYMYCERTACPVPGNWGSWSEWAPCSASCGGGHTSRMRLCDSPVPAFDGAPCNGSSLETKACNSDNCPACASIQPSFGTLLDCQETATPYLKTCSASCAPSFASVTSFPQYTCGVETGYLWSHQRDFNASTEIPSCSIPWSPIEIEVVQYIRLFAVNDNITGEEIMEILTANMVDLPCVQQGVCVVNVSTLDGQRRNQTLEIVFRMKTGFGNTKRLNNNDTETIQQFVRVFTLADDSTYLVVRNRTKELFSANFGNIVITPDVSSVTYNATVICPRGTTQVYFVCVGCPEGSREINGQCQKCPLGTYKKLQGSRDCIDCQTDSSLDLNDAPDINQCFQRVLPERVRLQYEMFYYTGSCNVSIDDLRQNFITRMNNSTWRDACPNVRLCTAEIVQVKYDPMRLKRSDENSRLRNVRDAVVYVVVKFDIVISYEENGRSPQDVYQELQSTKQTVSQNLKKDYEAGYFDIPCLPENEFGFGYPTLRAECPPGTAFDDAVDTQILSCKGCGMGQYLAQESDVCEVCPVGTYSELENATTCTPCTSGWSTYSSASQSASDCKELCVAGTVSKDGFGPCQVCPLGQYQPAVGSMTCLSCAAGTWTMRPRSKGIDQCIFVDAHLQNTSISLTVKESWSALTVTGWILLTENSSASLTFDFGSDGEVFKLDVFSEDIVSSDSSINNTLSTSAVINIISGSFSRLLLTFSSQTGNASLYHNDILVSSFHQSSFSASTPGQILIHALSGKVVVSGFNAKDQIASQEDINESSATCVDPANNILSWTPPPSTLYTPSMCDQRVLPERVRLQYEMFYYTGSCNVSIDDLRQNFITRMNNSIWKDACPNVRLCTAEIVQVKYGPVRHKRSDEKRRLRNVRDAVRYVAVKFDIVMSYEENGRSPQEVYQELQSTKGNIFQNLKKDFEAGYFDIPCIPQTEFGFAYPTLRVECPPGTAFDEAVDTQILSCKLCAEGTMSKGGFLPCQLCPLGQYQPAIGSITCLSCAAGTWTLQKGSQGIDQCI